MVAADLQTVQVWVATTPIDMPKSFDGLAEVVRSFLGRDPLSGRRFVFRNKGGYLVTILWWDHDGFGHLLQAMEQGEFHWPMSNYTAVEISPEQLLRLLSGSRHQSASRRMIFCKLGLARSRTARYNRPNDRD